MSGRRTDLLSEAVDGQPRGLRWFLRAVLPVFRAARLLFVLQAVGGAVGIVVGAVKLDGKLVVIGFGQMLLAAVLLSVNMDSDDVDEARGPDGAFVVRTSRRRRWRDERGFGRIRALVTGECVWVVAVRRREEDPFGRPLLTETAETEREALEVSRQRVRRIREGGGLQVG